MRQQKIIKVVAIVIIVALVVTTLFASIGSFITN